MYYNKGHRVEYQSLRPNRREVAIRAKQSVAYRYSHSAMKNSKKNMYFFFVALKLYKERSIFYEKK